MARIVEKFSEHQKLQFAAKYLKNGCKGTAAVREFGLNIKDGTMRVKSSELLRDPVVLAEIDRITAAQRKTSEYELADAMTEVDDALALAKEEKNPQAMVAAIKLKAHMNGLLVSDRENKRSPFEGMTDDQLRVQYDSAVREASQATLH
jgi:phage terminase small subunit